MQAPITARLSSTPARGPVPLRLIITGIAGLALAYFLVSASVTVVPAGYRGVVLEWGAVRGQTLNEGLHFRIPIAQQIEIMSVQTHAIHAKASSASHDLQTVATEVTLNYQLDPSRVGQIYQTLRHEYEPRVIAPAIQEAVKGSTSNYQAEALITQRETVRNDITENLARRLDQYGVRVLAVNITNFDFSPEFNDAVEAKVTAEQQAFKAKNDLERIKIEAEQTITRAEADARSIRIRAEALQQNQQLVAWEAVQKWDGKMPQVVSGDTVPFIQVPAPAAR
jgi:regulator of protease activity HflC (stomatin/prohibitin superfamily)